MLITDYTNFKNKGLLDCCILCYMKKRRLYLVLQFLFHDGQIRPAWCSSHRSHCCHECWPGFCPVVRSHHLSCQCRMQLRNGEHKKNKSLFWKGIAKPFCTGWSLCVCMCASYVYTVYCTYMRVFIVNKTVAVRSNRLTQTQTNKIWIKVI